MIHWYETVSDRFSNLLFVALSEFLFPHNVEILPVIMIFLWTAALTWLVYEARRMIRWQWHFFLDFFLAASLAFFAILQAPNRFQTIYWRSAMATHFAPLVYLTAFAALLLMLIRRNESRYPAVWIGFLCLIIAFFGGGFSEPPDAVLIVASALALGCGLGLGERTTSASGVDASGLDIGRRFAGIIGFNGSSPGNAFRFHPDRPDLMGLIYKVF